MSRQALGLRVAGTVFGIVAAGHLLRLATRAEVVIAGWEVPLGINALGVLIADPGVLLTEPAGKSSSSGEILSTNPFRDVGEDRSADDGASDPTRPQRHELHASQ